VVEFLPSVQDHGNSKRNFALSSHFSKTAHAQHRLSPRKWKIGAFWRVIFSVGSVEDSRFVFLARERPPH
jgi:hypothetical protein